VQLAIDRPEAILHVLCLGFDDMDQQAGTLEVGEELVPEADALMGSLQEARNVGDRELTAVPRLHCSQHRSDRGERVLGYLGPRVRDPAQE
jgi:hypothetical protein